MPAPIAIPMAPSANGWTLKTSDRFERTVSKISALVPGIEVTYSEALSGVISPVPSHVIESVNCAFSRGALY
jgi:hypothetical protein